MTEFPITVEELLATYWLDSENHIVAPGRTAETLRRYCEKRGLAASDSILEKAAGHLDGFGKGDVDQWVVHVCFFAHPHTLWNFMIDALRVAETNGHLQKIAAGLAEHILSSYGSMIPYFEARAREDSRFKRMLTGAWRHRMSDRVWMRLRAIQAEVPEPLSNMIPLENGSDYMSDSLKPGDRETDDKGRFVRDADGKWILSPGKG